MMNKTLLHNISEMIARSKDEVTVKVTGVKNFADNYIRITITPKEAQQLVKISAIIEVDVERIYWILKNNRKEKFANIDWVRYAFQTVPEKMLELLIADDYNQLANRVHTHEGLARAEHMGI